MVWGSGFRKGTRICLKNPSKAQNILPIGNDNCDSLSGFLNLILVYGFRVSGLGFRVRMAYRLPVVYFVF